MAICFIRSQYKLRIQAMFFYKHEEGNKVNEHKDVFSREGFWPISIGRRSIQVCIFWDYGDGVWETLLHQQKSCGWSGKSRTSCFLQRRMILFQGGEGKNLGIQNSKCSLYSLNQLVIIHDKRAMTVHLFGHKT